MVHLVMDPLQAMVHRAIRYYVVLTMPMGLSLSLVALTLMQGCVKHITLEITSVVTSIFALCIVYIC